MQTTASTLFILAKNPNLKPRRLKAQGDYYYTSAQPDQPKAALIRRPLQADHVGSADQDLYHAGPGSPGDLRDLDPHKEPCEKSGNSWLMEVNTSCGRLAKTPFGTVDNQGNFQSLNENVSISVIKLDTQTGQTGLVNEITWIAGPADKGVAFKLLPGTTGKVESVAQSDDKPPPAGGLTPKRISWEQIQ